MTVKELKEQVNAIPDKLDDREVVLDGYGTGGYNSSSDFAYVPIKVTENFPTNKENKKTKMTVAVYLQ